MLNSNMVFPACFAHVGVIFSLVPQTESLPTSLVSNGSIVLIDILTGQTVDQSELRGLG